MMADSASPLMYQALARAVYSRLPVAILDDVMSSLDSKTTSAIVARLFGKEGYFRKAGISVVIATHSRKTTTRVINAILTRSRLCSIIYGYGCRT